MQPILIILLVFMKFCDINTTQMQRDLIKMSITMVNNLHWHERPQMYNGNKYDKDLVKCRLEKARPVPAECPFPISNLHPAYLLCWVSEQVSALAMELGVMLPGQSARAA